MKLHRITIPLTVFMVAWVGSVLTGSGMNWYKTIILPSFAPPGFVIGIVWTVIFILSAMSAIIVWDKKENQKNFKSVEITYLTNAFLNVFWSFLFFVMHRIDLAVFGAMLLFLSVLWIIFLIRKISKISTILMLPYAGWVLFATFLNFYIWMLNR